MCNQKFDSYKEAKDNLESRRQDALKRIGHDDYVDTSLVWRCWTSKTPKYFAVLGIWTREAYDILKEHTRESKELGPYWEHELRLIEQVNHPSAED